MNTDLSLSSNLHYNFSLLQLAITVLFINFQIIDCEFQIFGIEDYDFLNENGPGFNLLFIIYPNPKKLNIIQLTMQLININYVKSIYGLVHS